MTCCKCANNPYWSGGDLPGDAFYEVWLPLLIDRYGGYQQPDATLDRASAASITDFEGNVIETLVQEFGFDGARRVENRTQQDLNSGSNITNAIVTNKGGGI